MKYSAPKGSRNLHVYQRVLMITPDVRSTTCVGFYGLRGGFKAGKGATGPMWRLCDALRPCSSCASTNSKDGRVAGIGGEARTVDLGRFVQVGALLATRGQCPQQDSNLRHTV